MCDGYQVPLATMFWMGIEPPQACTCVGVCRVMVQAIGGVVGFSLNVESNIFRRIS